MKKKKISKEMIILSRIDKASKKPTMEQIKEQNIRNLIQSGMLVNFVRGKNGSWEHDDWISLCDEISRSDFYPVDFDKVGLFLENEKAVHNENMAAVLA